MIGIVGAGLSGLACAQELHRQGRDFVVFEAADRVGGRVQSDVRDGFVLDRGFQVLLTSYPAVSRAVEIGALEPRYFESGAVLAFDGKTSGIFHPFFHPDRIAGLLTTPAISWMDRWRMACLGAGVLTASDDALLRRCAAGDDRGVAALLDAEGWSRAVRERFVEPFFGGVLLDDSLATSAALFLYYFKKFSTGRAWVPARGMGAFSQALAARIPAERLRLGTRIEGWEATGDRVTALLAGDGRKVPVEAVIVALDPVSRARLMGVEPPPMRDVAVLYFKSRSSLYSGGHLILPAGRDRVVRHFVQITNVAPEYAPAGWHLISATVLQPGRFADGDLFSRAMVEIQSIFSGAALEPLAEIRIPEALPVQAPGFAQARSRNPWRNVFPVGDGPRGASIQTALESGREAAFLCS